MKTGATNPRRNLPADCRCRVERQLARLANRVNGVIFGSIRISRTRPATIRFENARRSDIVSDRRIGTH